MDEAMRQIEERLESLVPKGISDHGRERLEQTVEDLAETVAREEGGPRGWKWGIGVAAGLGLIAGIQFLREPVVEPVVIAGIAPAAFEIALADEGVPWIETMAISRQVDGRTDEGWVESADSPHLYRSWGYAVTDEEEVLDEETGYLVTVYSKREEQIPVRITSL